MRQAGKIRAGGAADEETDGKADGETDEKADGEADGEADRKGGGSIRLAKQNRSRRCTETAFAPYIYKVYKSVLKNGAWKDAKWLSARKGLP